MRRLSIFFIVLLFVATLPASAATVKAQASNDCKLTGTWFGGSDPAFQFVFTFAPNGGNRYSARADLATDVQDLNYMYTWWTPWQGEAVKLPDGTYEQWGISYWVWDHQTAPQYGVDGKAPEMDIVHSNIEFIDCDTFVSTIDIYAAYLSFTPELMPFVSPVDLSWLPDGGTIVETYHRMPTTASPTLPERALKPVRLNSVRPLTRKR